MALPQPTPEADRAFVPTASAATWTGWFVALAASFSFSFAAPIARGTITSGMDPTTLVALRLLLSTVLSGVTVFLLKRSSLRMDRRGLLVTALAGGLNGFGMMLMFWSLARVAASLASMILSLLPLVVLTLLALRGERFTYRHTIRLMLGLTGAYFLIGPGGNADLIGVGLLVIAIFCFSGHMTLLQWYLRPYDALAVSFYISLAMASVVGLVWVLEGAHWQAPSWQGWLAVAALVLISTYLARLLMIVAINQIGSGQMALLTPLETLLTVTWSILFLGERLTVVQWIGGVLILASALLAIQRLGQARWPPRWRLWART